MVWKKNVVKSTECLYIQIGVAKKLCESQDGTYVELPNGTSLCLVWRKEDKDGSVRNIPLPEVRIIESE